MARPEGYRKAVRLMDMADRFGLPVITLVDTPGAYPGKGAEERGQSEAIARSTEKCLQIGVPLISVIIGEGGSGGAVAFATADRVAMLEHSIYSVISPEGCASILWKDAEKMREAAEALRLTAQDLHKLGVCDLVIKEPLGGAQRDRDATIAEVGKAIRSMLAQLKDRGADLIASRRRKFLDMGPRVSRPGPIRADLFPLRSAIMRPVECFRKVARAFARRRFAEGVDRITKMLNK
jgi:acetyl-CoA carboxylase carboxyl transferase subunit alpha